MIINFQSYFPPIVLWVVFAVVVFVVVFMSSSLLYHWRTYDALYHNKRTLVEWIYLGGVGLLILALFVLIILYTYSI